MLSLPTCLLAVFFVFRLKHIELNEFSSQTKCLLLVKCITSVQMNTMHECMYTRPLIQYLFILMSLCVFHTNVSSILNSLQKYMTGDNSEQHKMSQKLT